jgi:hypothetical protein
MRTKLSLILTLSAWLLATGSHWDLVQTYAWGRMIATYSQSMSVTEAVKKTFTPETMCNLCKSVATAKQSSKGKDAVPGGSAPCKIFLACAPVVERFISPTPEQPGLRFGAISAFSTTRAAPPVPPPRVAAQV